MRTRHNVDITDMANGGLGYFVIHFLVIRLVSLSFILLSVGHLDRPDELASIEFLTVERGTDGHSLRWSFPIESPYLYWCLTLTSWLYFTSVGPNTQLIYASPSSTGNILKSPLVPIFWGDFFLWIRHANKLQSGFTYSMSQITMN